MNLNQVNEVRTRWLKAADDVEGMTLAVSESLDDIPVLIQELEEIISKVGTLEAKIRSLRAESMGRGYLCRRSCCAPGWGQE